MIRRNVWVTPYYEEDLPRPAETIGLDKILFGSDWPHGEGLAEPTTFTKELVAFSAADVRKIMRDNVIVPRAAPPPLPTRRLNSSTPRPLDGAVRSNARRHDCLINVHFGDTEQPEWMFRVKDEYFKRDDSIFGKWEMSAVLDEMDANGVERAVVTGNINKPEQASAFRFVEERPDRFALSRWVGSIFCGRCRRCGGSRPWWPTCQLLRRPSALRSGATGCIRADDAVYYPLYTKCCELDLPLCMNTGLPGPPIPGEVQNPIHLDRVCVRFPELKLCMIHGADPWWDIAIRLMIKYRNLRLMTSAWSPKYLPERCCTTCARAEDEDHLRVGCAGALDRPHGGRGLAARSAARGDGQLPLRQRAASTSTDSSARKAIMPDTLIERRDGVVTVTFNRPHKRNALNAANWADLEQVTREVTRNPADRASGADRFGWSLLGGRRHHR